MSELQLKINELLYSRYQTSGERYVYFLLAIAASAIAISVQQTRNAVIAWTELPLGIAVILWAVSFAAGCYNRQWNLRYFIASQKLWKEFTVTDMDVIEHARDPMELEAAEKKATDVRNSISGKLVFWSRAQFQLLVLGAIFYIIWHVVGMASRTEWLQSLWSS